MIRRVTAREFQKRFQRLDEPVLVNDGIFFPKLDASLMAIAEDIAELQKAADKRPKK